MVADLVLLFQEQGVRTKSLFLTPIFMFIVISKVKEHFSSKGMQSSGDLAEAVSAKVEEMLEAAGKRAESNGRKTVRPDDL